MVTLSARVRPMTAADLEPAADLLRRGDFGDRLDFFSWAIERRWMDVLVAVDGDRILGTGTGAAHDRSGWVGVIFVTPDARGAGLGRRITRAVLDRLEARGTRTQLLIASPMGRPIYEREGFRVLDRQVRFAIDGLPPDGDGAGGDRGIRPFREDDRPAIEALDRAATGEDRRAVLDALVKPASTLIATGGDGDPTIRGFLARAPWRGGALIAPEPADALRLLERRRRSSGLSGRAGAGVLAGNARGRAALRAAGWEEELGGMRMIRGDALEWQPDAIFGQFNGALG
ncbi:MAG TPA: GNAT family N-acetyltransferase [Patescibacteria group bacterium]|nr:GNAT family N-acetyltransferase [Patescibacteria group bacterium]